MVIVSSVQTSGVFALEQLTPRRTRSTATRKKATTSEGPFKAGMKRVEWHESHSSYIYDIFMLRVSHVDISHFEGIISVLLKTANPCHTRRGKGQQRCAIFGLHHPKIPATSQTLRRFRQAGHIEGQCEGCCHPAIHSHCHNVKPSPGKGGATGYKDHQEEDWCRTHGPAKLNISKHHWVQIGFYTVLSVGW